MQYLGRLGATVDVVRNDEITLDEIAERAPDAVLLSPGPGVPRDAGISVQLVEWCVATATPLLGVCLGHQAIAEAFGGRIGEAPAIMHGKTSRVAHDGRGVFRGLPNPFEAMRYHSLVVDRSTLTDEIEVSAWTDDDVVMGVRHRTLPIEGVQFHPESVLTAPGAELLANFLQSLGATRRR